MDETCRTAFRDGVRLLGLGRTAAAREAFLKCSESRGRDPDYHYQLARLHLAEFHQAGDREAAQVHLDQALEEADSVLRLDPEHPQGIRIKFEIVRRPSWRRYQPDVAYELARKMVKADPAGFSWRLNLAHWMAGEVRFHTREPDRVPQDSATGLSRAEAELRQLLEQTPPFSPEESLALFELSRTLAKQGRHVEALQFLRRRLQMVSEAATTLETWRETALNLLKLGRFDQATKALVNALAIWVNPVDQWLLRVSLDGGSESFPDLPEDFLFPLRGESPPAFARLEFQDIAARLGIDRLDGNGPGSWGDYDGDGDPDLALAGSDHFIGLYRNHGDRFEDVTSAAGLAGIPSGYSLNFVDFDGDGLLDLYVALNGWSGPMPNRALRNRGNGTFEDVTETSGLGDPGTGFVSLWGDLDNDRDLDLIVANGVLREGSTPQIYENQGGGTFKNVTRAAGVREPGGYGAIGIALGDYDRDGDLDLFVNGWLSSPNRLYRNDGKLKFSEVAAQAGVLQPPHRGFVCFFLDYNNDSYPDILTTSQAPWEASLAGLNRSFTTSGPSQIHPDSSRLFLNNQDGTFSDVTLQAGLHYPMGVMAAGVGDLDNDGYVDLYFGTGDPSLSRLEPNRFFRNNGDGTFSDLTFSSDLGNLGKGHGITYVDFDEDGDLDLYAQFGGFYRGDWQRNAFYENRGGNVNRWLAIDLVGREGNRFAVGSQVIVKAGDFLQYREVKGGEGFGSTDPYRVFFGLGQLESVETVEVIWPNGSRSTLANVAANQVIAVREQQSHR